MKPLLALFVPLLFIIVACTPAEDAPLPTLMVLPTATTAPQNLIAWQALSDSIAPDETRLYSFEGRMGDKVRVRLVLEDGDAYAVLIAPDGSTLARGVLIETTLEGHGAYLVRVEVAGNQGARYDIGLSYTDQDNPALVATTIPQVVGVPTPTPAYLDLGALIQTLNDGEDVGGTLTERETRHVYLYEGRAGAVINVNMARIDGTLDPVLTLFDEAGRAIAMDSDSAGNQSARLFNVRLPADGLYTVQATSADQGTGAYRLILRQTTEPLVPDPPPLVTATPDTPYATPTLAPPAMDTRLVDHAPTLGNVRRAGDIQRFILDAQAGEHISISVQPYQNDTLRPRLELINPDGELVVSASRDNATSGAGIFAWGIVLELQGTYSLFVSADDGTTGAYTVSYGRGESARDAYQGELGAGIATDALITERGVRHVWQVNLRAGDVITLAVSPQDVTMSPRLQFTNQQGDVLAQGNSANRASEIERIAINQDGRYLIHVWDTLTNPQASYTLLWRYINLAPTPTPLPRWATLVSIAGDVAPDAYNFYPFIGRQGQSLRILVEAQIGTGNLDPIVTLLDADGREIARADDSDNSLNPDLRLTLPADGLYTVRVNGYLSGGAYRLTIAERLE